MSLTLLACLRHSQHVFDTVGSNSRILIHFTDLVMFLNVQKFNIHSQKNIYRDCLQPLSTAVRIYARERKSEREARRGGRLGICEQSEKSVPTPYPVKSSVLRGVQLFRDSICQRSNKNMRKWGTVKRLGHKIKDTQSVKQDKRKFQRHSGKRSVTPLHWKLELFTASLLVRSSVLFLPLGLTST